MFKELILSLLGFRKTGVKEYIEDPRDYKAEEEIKLGSSELPARVDLMNTFSMNQGMTNHCTAYSVTGIFAQHNIQQHKDKSIFFDPNELWAHQLRQGDADEKWGATLTSPLKSLKNHGLTYNGKKYEISGYAYVQKENWRKYLADGYRIHTGGYTNRPMIDSEYNYIVPKYQSGGHAWEIVGYDDNKAHYICQNSWGFWGDDNSGRFYLKYGDEKHLFRGFVIYDK